LGHKQPDTLAATRDANTGELSNGYALGNAGYSTAEDIGPSGRSSIGDSRGKLTNHLVARYGGSRAGISQPGQPLTGAAAGSGTRNRGAGGATTGAPTNQMSPETTDSARNTLTFFPLAAYGQSPLGESPFSSPGGAGELRFLNPSIYAAGSQGYSLSTGGRRGATGNSLQGSVPRDRLDSSISHYGLNMHPETDRSAKANHGKAGLQRNHVNTSILDAGNP